MIFKDYCIVIMGDTAGSLDELYKVCSDNPKVLNANGISICTFTSIASTKKLEEYFISLGRSFLIFELGPENSGYNIMNRKIHNGLFSHLKDNINKSKNSADLLLQDLVKSLENPFNSAQVSEKHEKKEIPNEEVKKEQDVNIDEDYYSKLSQKQKEKIIDEYLDKGYNNLTPKEKKILNFLTKK